MHVPGKYRPSGAFAGDSDVEALEKSYERCLAEDAEKQSELSNILAERGALDVSVLDRWRRAHMDARHIRRVGNEFARFAVWFESGEPPSSPEHRCPPNPNNPWPPHLVFDDAERAVIVASLKLERSERRLMVEVDGIRARAASLRLKIDAAVAEAV